MKKHNLAFVDLETTGLDPEKHEIIEVGCLIAEQLPRLGKGPTLRIIDELNLRIKPEHLETAEPEALRLNGYNETDWLFAVDLKSALEALVKKAAGAVMVGQNVSFDWTFLERGFERTGVKHNFHYHKLDLLSMAFAKLYDAEAVQRFSLEALADYFGLKNEHAHTAASDIKVTFEIYKRLLGI